MLEFAHSLNMLASSTSAIISGEWVANISWASGFNCLIPCIRFLCQSTCKESSGSSIYNELSPTSKVSIKIRSACFSPEDNEAKLIRSPSVVSTEIPEFSNFRVLLPENMASIRFSRLSREAVVATIFSSTEFMSLTTCLSCGSLAYLLLNARRDSDGLGEPCLARNVFTRSYAPSASSSLSLP